MNKSVIVDTDILIDISRKEPQSILYLTALSKTYLLSVSAVTHMELIVGCRNKAELQKLTRFLQRFQVLPITAEISAKGIELLQRYRLSHGLLIADSLIAATAIVQGAMLATKNQRDYRFITSLTLLPYL